ncbi:MAG TPA: family 10 glycosylhydrolase [Candidatus Acidoferrum sp.]|nr:family 10 glycosylhydrolase [Candidatus Acidoferrum sp.]
MKKLLLLVCALISLLLTVLPASASVPEQLRGVWVATVYSIDFPSSTNVQKQKEELCAILDTAKAAGMNAVFFQVRPTGDAYYQSDIFPWAKSLTGTAGKNPGWDPLTYLIEEGKTRGIEIHAWVNPYRLTEGSADAPNNDISALPSGHPVRDNPAMAVPYDDGKLYLDPGNPEARELVVEGIKEIVQNYDVAGIHFDDYFYPSPTVSKNGTSYTASFNDSASYARYGGSMSLADWRRSNTEQLVREVYEAVKELDPDCQFGIAPSGIWRNAKNDAAGSSTNGFESYTSIYADTRGWVKKGILDYICPQIYWTIGQTGSDYKVLVNWWSDVCAGTGVDLYVGHAAYKVGTSSPAAWSDKWEMARQVELNRDLGTVAGDIYYGLTQIEDNTLDLATTLATLYEVGGAQPTNTAAAPKADGLIIAYPSSGASLSSARSYIIGAGDPNDPITVNGQVIDRTASGYFSLYVDLAYGVNTFTFQHKGETVTYTLNRPQSVSPPAVPYVMESAGFRPGSLWPTEDKRYAPKETFTLSCVAPTGATSVTAKLDGTVYALNPGATVSTQGIPCRTYSYTVTMAQHAGLGLIDTGAVTYQFVYNGKTYSTPSAGSVYCYMQDPTLIGTILYDATIMRTSNTSSADRKTPLYKGAMDYIIWETPSYYQLRYGGWTLKENVKTGNLTLPSNYTTAMTAFSTPTKTIIRWKLPYFPAYETVESDTGFSVTLHNTSGRQPMPLPAANALFSAVTFRQVKTDAVYTFTTKREGGLYGYKLSYEDGYLRIEFDNPPAASGATILLDAGHGGTDPGATGPMGRYGDRESQLNLRVAKAVRDKLIARGFKVVMARTDDSSVTLDTRAALIRATDPALAVSIHHNSMDAGQNIANYAGPITFYTENQSKRFAKVMQAAVSEAVGSSRTNDFRFQALAVCRIQECPAILIELGFISNPYEYESLASDSYIDKEAQGIVNGIVNFLNS